MSEYDNDSESDEFDEIVPTSFDPLDEVERWLEQSRRARARGDLKQALYADHWALQVLIFKVKDLKRAYDLAVQAALDARKPLHRDQMERVCVHEDLIFTYVGIDPIGYADLIENALKYMKQESNPSMECHYCLFEIQAAFQLSCPNLEQATSAVQNYFSETQQHWHHHGISHTKMCELMYRHGDWEKLLYFGQRGEHQLGAGASKAEYVAIVLAAQALALHKLGRDAEAITTSHKAIRRANAVRSSMHHSYYTFLSDFHMAAGDLQAAINLRKRQLNDMKGKGQTYWEAHTRLQLAHLLKQKGEPYQEEVILIRALATTLRNPEIINSQLDGLIKN